MGKRFSTFARRQTEADRERDPEPRAAAPHEETGNVESRPLAAGPCKDDPAGKENVQRADERWLSLFYETVSDVLYVLAVEPDDCFRFESVNHAFLRATGLTADQVVGKRIEDVLPPPAHALVIGKYKEAIRENKTVRWEEVSAYPTGTLYGLVAVTPAWSQDGVCTHLFGSVHDITERKRTEDQISMFRRFAEAASQGFGIATLDGRITYVNQALCRLVGAKGPDDMVGKSISLYTDEESWRRLGKDIIPAVLQDGQWAGELNAVSLQGEVTPTYESHFLIRDDLGKPVFLAAVLTDITERKRTDKALKEQLAELNRWHEATLGRETRILQLKAEVNELLAKAGQPPRYVSADPNLP